MSLTTLLLLLNLLPLSTAQLPTSITAPPLTQPFLHPTHGDILLPGTTFTLLWTPLPTFQTITLQLWDKTSWGFSRDLLSPCHPWVRSPFCGTIASSAPNTGSFEWTVPNPLNGSLGYGFPRGEAAFWVKMYVEDYMREGSGNGEPVVSYSQNFGFARLGEGAVTVTVVTTATVTEGGSGTSEGRGPPTVYVTVGGNGTGMGTATATGEEGGVSETAAATRGRNSTKEAPLEGRAARVGSGGLGAVMLLMGLL